MPASVALFQKYRSSILIETGTWHGDGVQAALDAGFPCVYSIELSSELYCKSWLRFVADPRVFLHQGDSARMLPLLLAQLSGQITFWLDAHYSSGDTARGPVVCPLLGELDAIAHHPVNTHTILIDDVRLLGAKTEGGFPDVTLQQVIDTLWLMNPDYYITQEGDVLVASVED